MQFKPVFKMVAFLMSLALIGLLSGCGGDKTAQAGKEAGTKKQTIRLTVGSANTPESTSWTKIVDEYFIVEVNKRLAEKTNYQIDWNKAYGGSVAKTGEELKAVQQGLLDVSCVVVAYEASRLPLHNFTYWVPFGPPDPVMLSKVVRKIYDEFPIMKGAFEKDYNQKFLGFAATQNYNLVAKFPVKSVDDLKGKKIAAVGPNLHFLKGSGSVPVQSTIPEMYTSFQTGVYEGWVMYPNTVVGLKIWEVAPYYIKGVDFGSIILTPVTININTWNKLPEEVKKVFLEVGNDLCDVAAKDVKDSFEKDLALWKEKGGKIIEFDPVERAKWAEMLPNNPNERAKELDAKGYPASQLLKRYFQLLSENGYKLPRTFEIN